MRFIALLGLLYMLGCSSQQKETRKEFYPRKNLNKKTIHVKNPKKLTPGKYNVDVLVRKVLGNQVTEVLKDNPEGFVFTEIDNKNGYAKLECLCDGFLEYFLFVGKKKNLLVSVSWDCGPECTQYVKAYSFVGGEYTSIGLEKVLSKKAVVALKPFFEDCVKNYFTIEHDTKCQTKLDFPRLGTVVNYTAGGHLHYEGAKHYVLHKLNWNRKDFRFELIE